MKYTDRNMFPNRTVNARAYAGQELKTTIVGARRSHIDVNGNSIWLIATPHGVFRTSTGAALYDDGGCMEWASGRAVRLHIDGRGTVYGADALELGGTPAGRFCNGATCGAWKSIVNVESITRAWDDPRVPLADIARRVYDAGEVSTHPADGRIDWSEIATERNKHWSERD